MQWIYMSLGDSWIRAQTQVTSSHMTLRHPDTANVMKVWCFTVRGRGYIPNHLPFPHLFSFAFICLLLWLIQAAKHDDSPDRRWPMYQVPDENLDWSIARILLRCYFAHWDMKCFFMHKPNLCMFFLQTSKIWVKRKIYLFLCNLEGGIRRRIWSMDPS